MSYNYNNNMPPNGNQNYGNQNYGEQQIYPPPPQNYGNQGYDNNQAPPYNNQQNYGNDQGYNNQPYNNQQQQQQGYPPQSYPPQGYAPQNYGDVNGEKKTYEQTWEVADGGPKWNDLWAGILFLLVCGGFVAVSGIVLQGYGECLHKIEMRKNLS